MEQGQQSAVGVLHARAACVGMWFDEARLACGASTLV